MPVPPGESPAPGRRLHFLRARRSRGRDQRRKRVCPGGPLFVARPPAPEAGRRLAAELTNAIRDCDAFLLLLSCASNRSDYVSKEVAIAHHFGKPIIPVQLEPSQHHRRNPAVHHPAACLADGRRRVRPGRAHRRTARRHRTRRDLHRVRERRRIRPSSSAKPAAALPQERRRSCAPRVVGRGARVLRLDGRPPSCLARGHRACRWSARLHRVVGRRRGALQAGARPADVRRRRGDGARGPRGERRIPLSSGAAAPPRTWVHIDDGTSEIGAAVEEFTLLADLHRVAQVARRPILARAATFREIRSFAISATCVTNDEYFAFTRATGHRRPKHWETKWMARTGAPFSARLASRPVVHVGAHDAIAYCIWPGAVCRRPASGSVPRAVRSAARIRGATSTTRSAATAWRASAARSLPPTNTRPAPAPKAFARCAETSPSGSSARRGDSSCAAEPQRAV